MVVFFTALLLVSTMAVGLRVYTEGKRQKEKEMIWRGKQYTRGIKMYYRKLGRFPTSLDDLVKPKVGSIRFMRQQYLDPMNKEDGSWRLIYVGPAGNLIGSLKPPQNNILLPAGGGLPGQPGSPTSGPGSVTSSTSGFSIGGPQTGAASPGSGTTAIGTTGSTPGASTGTAQATPGTVGGSADPSQIPTGDTPTIVGGNIIGVGSKINESSIIVYETATNYRLFEFIWDPSKDLGLVRAPGQQIGSPAGTPGAPGQNPLGGPPNSNPSPNPTGAPTNPTPNPTPNPNPPQQ
jgi:hypothetical protein